MWTIRELKKNAKLVLKTNYWMFVLAAFVLAMAAGSSSYGVSFTTQLSSSSASFAESISQIKNSTEFALMLAAMSFVLIIILVVALISYVFYIFVTYPLLAGCRTFFQRSYEDKCALGLVASGFTQNYLKNAKTGFQIMLYKGLWSCLFVIPGIVKSYEYRMIPYVMADYPDMTTKEAFKASKHMMKGEKWKTFLMDVSFLGWIILGCCTCSILTIFYVNPYKFLTDAGLYRVLKNKLSTQAIYE